MKPMYQLSLGSLFTSSSSLESSLDGLFTNVTSSWLTLKHPLNATCTWNFLGIQVSEGESSDYVLKLLKNIYGQKQAGRVWNKYLVDKLTSLGYKASLIDDCVFYRGDIIFMVYVDDGIFLGKDDEQLKASIREIQESGLNIEDQGHPADYVGVNIKKLKDGSYEFTQRALIDAIIADVGLEDSTSKPVPAKVAILLHAFKDAPAFDLNFNYRSVVGK